MRRNLLMAGLCAGRFAAAWLPSVPLRRHLTAAVRSRQLTCPARAAVSTPSRRMPLLLSVLRGGGGARGLRYQAGSSSTALAASTATAAPSEVAAPKEVRRLDYKQPSHWTRKVELSFQLVDPMHGGKTVVTSRLQIEPNSGVAAGQNLFLDGDDLELLAISVDGKPLKEGADYVLLPEGMDIKAAAMPAAATFVLETTTAIKPEENTQLSGLYKSGPMLCTQCEASGFRRITWSQDRPDVMSAYRVRVEADAKAFPVLLSNGNKVEAGAAAGGRHYAVYEDPWPKPSYLFALVAGDLGSLKGDFTTASGRKVALELFSEHRNAGKMAWAMESLKNAFKWDEDTYGLEYDLDNFYIVATEDFNMGAMENKGLNIFNTAYVLADPATATDTDYENIEGVIAHEEFHNWTGNRVTCRDWFQLTLKEGLTVFRDQKFSSDMGSAAVKRVEDVRSLRARQFPEDSGPLAHPIRPDSYIQMDNLYTATVYSKGAEVIRMYQTLLGEPGFRKGMDLYFKRHDGQAVTCDDFRAAMADANNVDLGQFGRWYSQAGTPTITAKGHYDAGSKTYTLQLSQTLPPAPKNAAVPEPFVIPVATGLMYRSGEEAVPTRVLQLMEAGPQEFKFEGITSEPLPSLLRGFSAPVKLNYDYSDEDLAFLSARDTDLFNRWEAGQKLAGRVLSSLTAAASASPDLPLPALPRPFVDAFRATLEQRGGDMSLQAYALRLPDMASLAEEMKVVDPDALHAAYKHTREALVAELSGEFEKLYDELAPKGPYVKSAAEVGRRRLRNVCLSYLHDLPTSQPAERCWKQFAAADNMTDKLAALACLADLPGERRDAALQKFYDDASGDALVLNKWFAVQASADLPDLEARVRQLMQHPDFTIKNPNRLRSVISVFAGTLCAFHRKDGSGYALIGDCVRKLDPINPQVAARLAGAFSKWRRFDEGRQALAKAQLEQIRDQEKLSKDTFEVVSRCLAV